mgnify:CR=1 FL=1|tara:strand:- start:8065 stop:9102 length:1038 start_codon:yes stop_codon:yes gene_type:complete
MTINADRPTIRYENVSLLKGGATSYSNASNNASSIKLVPLVQDFSFNFNTKTEDILTLGNKFYSKRINRYDVDVNLDVTLFETFEDMFSGFFSGNALLDDLNKDASFYFLVGKKKNFDNFSDADETINFGNAFIENFSLSQSKNQFLSSKYSYSCSNVNAEELVSNDIANPAIDLTGTQLQNLTSTLPDVQSLLDSQSNLQDKAFPAYKTNVSISGIQSQDIFLVKPDMVQDFNLSIPFDRKKIFKIGKKYPIQRRFVDTTEASISISCITSEFVLNGSDSNLKSFLTQNDSYVINLNFLSEGSQSQNFEISAARLNSNSQSASLSQDLNGSFSFDFNPFDFKRL